MTTTKQKKESDKNKYFIIVFGLVILSFIIGLLVGLFGKKCRTCPSNNVSCPSCSPNSVECPSCPTTSQCPSPITSQCPSPITSQCPATSTSGVVSVGVSSIQDLDNTSVNTNGALANVIDNLSNTAWNPTRGGSTTYRLLFNLNRQAAIKYVIVNLTGDTTHDPTSLNIYTNSNKTTLLASVGDTMRGKNLIQIEIQNPVSTNQIYMEIGKTTQYQLYLNGVFFFA